MWLHFLGHIPQSLRLSSLFRDVHWLKIWFPSCMFCEQPCLTHLCSVPALLPPWPWYYSQVNRDDHCSLKPQVSRLFECPLFPKQLTELIQREFPFITLLHSWHSTSGSLDTIILVIIKMYQKSLFQFRLRNFIMYYMIVPLLNLTPFHRLHLLHNRPVLPQFTVLFQIASSWEPLTTPVGWHSRMGQRTGCDNEAGTVE